MQEWLFEHGYVWCSGKEISDFKEKYLTNTCDTGYLSQDLLHGHGYKDLAQEITLEFETVVKSVKLPEVAPKKTEAQMKLEELQRTIEDAQRQIAKLKEEIK